LGAAVALDLSEDGFDHALAFEVELCAPVAGQHAAGEVIKAAAASGAWFFAAVGVGRNERLDALADEVLDGVVLPIAGVSERSLRLLLDARGPQSGTRS
jgi:hypothetical protein